MFYALSEEEHENMAHQEASHDREAETEEEDIDYYLKQFVDFMQAQPLHKYNLSSSKNRSR